ncbi:MAG: Flavin-dependent tryptophan halogenase RebH [Planctomycetota bacterium]
MAAVNFEADLPRRIAVVGGGATGWMAAALLGRCFCHLGVKVTVIEPPGKRGIGVGEATIPSIHRLLGNLGVSENDFMLACDATFKLGIQFSDWLQVERDYWHPFGVCGAKIDGQDLFHYWFAERSQKRVLRPYHSYSLQWAASLASKSPHLFGGMSPISQTQSYAFHMDAMRFADWLQAYAVSQGVEFISDTVEGFSPNERGDIAQLRLASGVNVSADLYLDCTGFESHLIQKFLGVNFIDWSQDLLCDRAVAIRTEPNRQPSPYTRATALEAGWYWSIPLCSRTGFGYVYSSRHMDDQAACESLQSAISYDGTEREQINDPLFLKLRVGRLQEFWKGNVVAIGLASGFIEPLESTGIHLTQVAIELLLELLPDRRNSEALQTAYNRRMADLYDQVKDFVQMHYALSRREETFWKDARDVAMSPSLVERLELYDECGWIDGLRSDGFQETSYYHILTGNGRVPRRPNALSLSNDPERIQDVLQQILAQNEQMLAQLPLHREMLDWIHTKGQSESLPTGRLI